MMSSKKRSVESLTFAVLATDVVCFRIIDKQLSVLLGKISNVPSFVGKWGLIGGLILPTETAGESVERHLSQKAGIKNLYKEQLYTFSGIDRDPRGRVVTVAYMALSGEDPQDLSQARIETKWLPVADLPRLGYDHNEIVAYAVERLRSKISYTNIAQHLLPEEFTLSELQGVYEIVLGEGLDKRNFRKKILAGDLLTDTKRTRKIGIMRPAALYSFSSKKQQVVNIL